MFATRMLPPSSGEELLSGFMADLLQLRYTMYERQTVTETQAHQGESMAEG